MLIAIQILFTMKKPLMSVNRDMRRGNLNFETISRQVSVTVVQGGLAGHCSKRHEKANCFDIVNLRVIRQ